MNIYNIIVIIFLEIFFTISGYSSNIFSNKKLSIEIFKVLSTDSLYFKNKTYSFDNMPNSFLTDKKLKSYIRNIDKYGDYFSKKEYQSYNSTISSEYVGIGMILFKKKNSNAVFCIPISSKLKKMGISKNDQLIEVNGKVINGISLYIISSLIRGKKNTYVNIKIKKNSGKMISLNLQRTHQHYNTVEYTMQNRINMLKIIEFKKETAEELLSILLSLRNSKPIVIDLRDNSGGDLFSAIESADLFLEKGTYIGSIKTMKSKVDYYALNQNYIRNKTVILLQNKNTASASEVFISALTENYCAESIGSKTFGKGIAQKIVPLSNGGAILFSYAILITPNGNSYNNKGLLPTLNISLNKLLKENLKFRLDMNIDY